VIWQNQVLDRKQVSLVRVESRVAYLDVHHMGLVEAGYGPQAQRVTV
jgi:hypothetical protein